MTGGLFLRGIHFNLRHRVHGFGHLRADCRGPRDQLQNPTLVSSMGLPICNSFETETLAVCAKRTDRHWWQNCTSVF